MFLAWLIVAGSPSHLPAVRIPALIWACWNCLKWWHRVRIKMSDDNPEAFFILGGHSHLPRHWSCYMRLHQLWDVRGVAPVATRTDFPMGVMGEWSSVRLSFLRAFPFHLLNWYKKWILQSVEMHGYKLSTGDREQRPVPGKCQTEWLFGALCTVHLCFSHRQQCLLTWNTVLEVINNNVHL